MLVAAPIIQLDPSPATTLANLQAGLNQIFGTGNTKVLASSANNFDVAFIGQLARTNMQAMTFSLTATPISLTPVADGNNTAERQRINFTGPPTGGTFQLQFGTITSGNITYSSNANTLQLSIQAQLNSLFGTNNARAIVITPLTVDIVFGNALAGVNIDQMLVANVNLTGGVPVTGNIAVGSNSVTNLSSTAGLTNGMFVTGLGIPPNTSITAVGPGNAITLSNAATASGTAVALAINGVTTAGVNDGSGSAVQQITLTGAISSTTTGTLQIAYGSCFNANGDVQRQSDHDGQ
jgi:hypothetical protein